MFCLSELCTVTPHYSVGEFPVRRKQVTKKLFFDGRKRTIQFVPYASRERKQTDHGARRWWKKVSKSRKGRKSRSGNRKRRTIVDLLGRAGNTVYWLTGERTGRRPGMVMVMAMVMVMVPVQNVENADYTSVLVRFLFTYVSSSSYSSTSSSSSSFGSRCTVKVTPRRAGMKLNRPVASHRVVDISSFERSTPSRLLPSNFIDDLSPWRATLDAILVAVRETLSGSLTETFLGLTLHPRVIFTNRIERLQSPIQVKQLIV